MARTSNKTFKLKHTIAENVTARPEDILAAKRVLYDMGFYEAPDWGITDIPDRALFDGIRDYQRANGLREDGVMKPGGETEAMMLKANGGAGKNKGSYIWHTVGDGKVRSSHAERDGKTFSWDDPPEGGHPGEAYNCRCRAEEENKKDCEKLKWEMIAAWERHDPLHKQIEDTKDKMKVGKKILRDLETELSAIWFDMPVAMIPSRPKRKLKPSDIVGGVHKELEIQRLIKRKETIEKNIEIRKGWIAEDTKKLEQLLFKQANYRQISEELSRRYQACLAQTKDPKK